MSAKMQMRPSKQQERATQQHTHDILVVGNVHVARSKGSDRFANPSNTHVVHELASMHVRTVDDMCLAFWSGAVSITGQISPEVDKEGTGFMVCSGERGTHLRAVDGDAHCGEFRHEERHVIVLVLHDLRGEGLRRQC